MIHAVHHMNRHSKMVNHILRCVFPSEVWDVDRLHLNMLSDGFYLIS